VFTAIYGCSESLDPDWTECSTGKALNLWLCEFSAVLQAISSTFADFQEKGSLKCLMETNIDVDSQEVLLERGYEPAQIIVYEVIPCLCRTYQRSHDNTQYHVNICCNTVTTFVSHGFKYASDMMNRLCAKLGLFSNRVPVNLPRILAKDIGCCASHSGLMITKSEGILSLSRNLFLISGLLSLCCR